MNKTIFSTGIFFGVLAVVLGAFASHGLKNLLEVDAIETFKTGVTYQMYHALLLLIVGGLTKIPEKSKKILFWFIVLGIIFFSFSIYGLATNSLTSFDFKTIAFITPIGGLFLISGWILLGIRCLKDFK
ncbi:MAG: DUF423 domain-containing protein [Cellulophaga sp.]|nr:DUF423 domain-containing protein [Cellulophaga sp.]